MMEIFEKICGSLFKISGTVNSICSFQLAFYKYQREGYVQQPDNLYGLVGIFLRSREGEGERNPFPTLVFAMYWTFYLIRFILLGVRFVE